MIIRAYRPGLDTGSFSCGDFRLDAYLQKQAAQDARRGFASVFVAFEDNLPRVVGYYALSAASVEFSRLTTEEVHGMPRYPQVPAVRLGRLAVDQKFQGQGVGGLLLFDAMRRSCAGEIAWAFFLVEARNARAQAFYEKFYFASFADNPLAMWLKRKQAERLVAML